MNFKTTELFPDLDCRPTSITIESNSYVWERLQSTEDWKALTRKHDELTEQSRATGTYGNHMKSIESGAQIRQMQESVYRLRMGVKRLNRLTMVLSAACLAMAVHALLSALLG